MSLEKDIRAFSIDIVTRDRVWILSAESFPEMEKWISLLATAVGSDLNSFESIREGFLTKQGSSDVECINKWDRRTVIFLLLSLTHVPIFS
jgi:hypothetical protein